VVGSYLADLWVADRVIVEIKAVRSLSKAHEVQLVNYLAATGVDTGLLLNFSSSVEIKRKFRAYKPGGRSGQDLRDIDQDWRHGNPVNPVEEEKE
jgi:hypothetical protein